MEEKFLKLTNAVYKLLEFFPESDPLKNRAKDKALVIMENLVLVDGTDGWASFQKEKIKIQLLEDIDILLGYLHVGKSQGWLSAVNCLIISNEYEKIKKDIKPILELTKKLPGMDGPSAFQESAQIGPKEYPEPVLLNDNTAAEESAPSRFVVSDRQNPPPHEITPRQKKIIEFLTNNGKGQVMDFKAVLPDVTKRTIRRDLDELMQQGKIERMGEFNQVVYKIKQ